MRRFFFGLVYDKNCTFCKAVDVCQLSDDIFNLYNHVPPSKTQAAPLHMLCMYVATFLSPNGFLGLRGGGVKNKLL